MTILTQLIADRDAARKASDGFKVKVLSTVIGEIQGKWSALPIDSRGESASDSISCKTLISFVNNLTEFLKVKNTEEGQNELSLLQTYLPQPLTLQQLEEVVKNRLATYTEADGNKIKFVMDHLKVNYENLYDGKAVRQFII